MNRYLGCLLGLACGDAVGTSVEFEPRGSFEEVTDMNGGGPFNLSPGEWTDDTSMALCFAESLIECDGFDPTDQMERYTKWLKEGYLSSTGECFDIGNTTREAILNFVETGEPYSGSTDPDTAGNGSIMRLAPIPMYYSPYLEKVIEYSAKSSRTTHGAKEAVDASKLFGMMISLALQGKSKEAILFDAGEILGLTDISEKIKDIALGTYKLKTRDEIRSKGYVVESQVHIMVSREYQIIGWIKSNIIT